MKEVRNSNYYYPKEQYIKRCPKYNKEATITIYYRATQLHKTDIQLTPIELGRKCSLWNENKDMCLECPILNLKS